MTYEASVIGFGVEEGMSLKDIRKELDKYAEIITLFPNFKHTGAFSGSITVVLKEAEACDQFLEKFSSLTINGTEIKFQKYSSTYKKDVIFNLHIRNIPRFWSEEELKRYCANFGTISSCIRIQKQEDFVHGFVCYADKASYENALNSTLETVFG